MPLRTPVPVTYQGVLYPSISAAARAAGVSPGVFSRRYYAGELDLLHVDKRSLNGGSNQAYKPVIIRGVYYSSCTEAAHALGVHQTCVSRARRKNTLDRVGAGYLGKSPTPLVPPKARDLNSVQNS